MVEKPYRHPLLSTVDRTLTVRMEQRLPLGMNYQETVEVVGTESPCTVVIDATGVGRPVVDLLQSAGLGCQVQPVTITGGNRQHRRAGEGSAMNVPKVDLVAQLLVALEQGELKIAARMKEAGTLRRELLDVRLQRRQGAGFRFGAEGYGEHDDLVIALAVWRARFGRALPDG